MHEENIKLTAYTLYLQGLNAEQIAEQIRKDFGKSKFAANTVRRWAEDKNDKNETWETQKQKVHFFAKQQIERSSAGRISEYQERTQTLIDILYERLLSDTNIKIGSYDSALYSIKTLMEFALKLEDKKTGELSPIAVVQNMLEIFNSIPQIRTALKHNWEKVTQAIQARLMIPKDITPQTQQEQVVNQEEE